MSRKTVLVFAALVIATAGARAAAAPANLFANPSFEMGKAGWHVSKAGGTACDFTVDGKDAADGGHSVLVTLGRVEEWGAQFGQTFAAGKRGKTYTFAVVAKSTRGPVAVDLQIERNAKPWDRAAKGKTVTLTNEWQELHVTFTVAKDFPQGWFAYLSCTQPNAQYRADLFRLYEGDYVPYKDVEREQAASAAARLFDTGRPSRTPLTGEAVAKRVGWKPVPEDTTDHAFGGDAVLVNNCLAVVLRRGASGAEVYSLDRHGATMRARLAPVGGPPGRISTLTIAENAPSSVAVDAAFTNGRGAASRVGYALKMGQAFVETTAAAGVECLRVEAPCRFAVLPDFFADDIVLDAAELPVAQADLPADNVVLHLLPDRGAIVMTIVKTVTDDVRITLSGEGAERRIHASQIPYGKDGKLWVAVLAAPDIWHTHAVAKEDAGKILRLDWAWPFPAQWRADWRRDGGLTDSWEIVAERPDHRFTKQGWYGGGATLPPNRKRWTTVLGSFLYPCWVDRAGRGHLQPLRSKALRFDGPVLIYPINRATGTPLDAFTVVDIVRNTLGVGPCEYILDVEGQQSSYKGRATCSTRDTLNPIYARNQQRQQRAKIEKTLDEVMVFIRHIRARIERYVAFGHDLRSYLAEQKKAHPELADRLAELETLARAIDERVAARRDSIKTPAYAQKMCDDFRKTMIDYDGGDALDKCKRFTKALVAIGGSQDELAGECRWAVKLIRQRAGLMMALEPRLSAVAREIRHRAQKVMRHPAGHEGARH